MTLALIWPSLGLIAQEVSWKIDPAVILLGDQTTLTINLSFPSGGDIKHPALADTLTKSIEILELLTADTTDVSPEKVAIEFKYRLTSFDTGYHAIPPRTWTINGSSVTTQPLLLSVLGFPIKEGEIADIKQVVSDPMTLKDWISLLWKPIVFGLLGLALLITLIIWLVKRKKKTPVKIAPKVIIPAYKTALERLSSLEEQKLWQQGEVKQFHVLLSEILREYIEGQFKIPALEQTTDEIMQSARYTDWDEELKQELRRNLFLSDMVKFAKEKPVASDNERALKFAFDFVIKTKPKATTNEKEDNASH